MSLTTNKTIYLNGQSKDGDDILANFNASLSENGSITINETRLTNDKSDVEETDFKEFRDLAVSLTDKEVN